MGLPEVSAGHRRRWLVRLVAVGLGRGLLLAALALATRGWLMSVSPSAPPTVAAPTGLNEALAAAPWPPGALLAIFLAGLALLAALRHRQVVDAEALAQHYIAHVRLRLFDRLSTLDTEAASRRSRGALLMRFTGDVAALRDWIGRGVAGIIVAGSTIAVLGAVLAWLWWPAAAWLAAVLAGSGLAVLAMRGGLDAATRAARRRTAALAAFMQDRIAVMPLLQQAPRAVQRRRLSRLQRRLRAALARRAQWRGGFRALGDVAVVLLVAAAATLAAPIGARGSLGIDATDTARLAAALLLGLLVAPTREAVRVAEIWVMACVAGDRLRSFLDRGAPLQDVAGACDAWTAPDGVLRLVSPRWQNRVQGPSAEVLPGRRVAVVGPSGSGKTSLLWLLAGLRPPDDGRIQLGCEAVRASDAAGGDGVVLVSADLPLVRGTVEENLRWHGRALRADAVQQAWALAWQVAGDSARRVELADRVDDGGTNLSHGQRRTLALARSLAARPAVLLIDEPAATLPGEPRVALERLLDGYAGTVIFATCDPTLSAWADAVWPLQPARSTSGSRSGAVSGPMGPGSGPGSEEGDVPWAGWRQDAGGRVAATRRARPS
jgi:ABC-type multidrug transport system fused ATPase/permease subunit